MGDQGFRFLRGIDAAFEDLQVADVPLRWRRRAATWITFEDADDWVVYQPASADIHLVAPVLHHIWSLIPDTGGADATALARTLADTLQVPEADAAATVADALSFMDEAGLITPESPTRD